MNSSDFRTEARNKLTGKWGKAVIITLCYIAITSILSLIENNLSSGLSALFSIFVLVVGVPLGFGFTFSLLKLYKDEEVSYFDFFTLGFNNFSRSWGITLNTFLKMILPIVLMIVSYILMAVGIVGFAFSSKVNPSLSSVGIVGIIGIILFIISLVWSIMKSYFYQLSTLLAMEDSELSPKDAVYKSEEIMTGHRAELFILQLSFIGWAILATLVCGIGLLWVIPYIQFATIAFYMYHTGNKTKEQVETVSATPSVPETPAQETTPVQEESVKEEPIQEEPIQETSDESNIDPIQSNEENQE